jgi:membrane protein DedA with SNARE-associated domain
MGELSSLFAKYGYWAVFFGVLLEDAGLPLPGETILLYASFLAHSKHELQLPYVILIAIIAATMGDNIGYGLGRYGGRPLLDRYKHIFHISPEIVARGERLMERYGALAVFFGRFITGLRILAGPLAGTLHMSWKKFAIFNFLGAAAWVTAVSLAGYLFAGEYRLLIQTFGRVQVYVLLAAIAIGLFWWWHHKKARDRREHPSGR